MSSIIIQRFLDFFNVCDHKFVVANGSFGFELLAEPHEPQPHEPQSGFALSVNTDDPF